MEAAPSSIGPINPVVPGLEIYYPAKYPALSPLSFGRVNDDRPVTSQTLLFRLPIELVHEVTAYLNNADLRSLALVDRDCRQLARSRLFTSVVLDSSDKKRALLDKLSRLEAWSRRDNDGVTESPSIGACIRRLTVARHTWEPSGRNRKWPPADDSIGKEKECAMHGVVGSFRGSYLLDVAEALRFSLPNLDEFIWRDRAEFPQHMLTAIARKPIRRLGLYGVRLPLDCEYQLPPLRQQRWALQSLDLEMAWYAHAELWDSFVSKFCLVILKAAAPTLEELSWRGFRGIKLSFGNSAIRFPRLRTLSLDTHSMPDDTALDSFFPADAENYVLCSVSISVPALCGQESLAQRGCIRGLQSMRLYSIMDDPPNSKAADVALLSANPQLKSLTLLAPKPERLTTTLLPLLASEFKCLTTLIAHFTSPSVGLSEFLAAIGRLTSLTSLWIVAGERYDWAANVPLTISALSPLRNLARLGLSRQYTYGVFLAPESEDRYKEKTRNTVGLFVRAFRGLRWVYFGFLVHRVVGNEVVPGEEGFRYYSPQVLWKSLDW